MPSSLPRAIAQRPPGPPRGARGVRKPRGAFNRMSDVAAPAPTEPSNTVVAEARHRIGLVCSAYAAGQSGQSIVLDALTRSPHEIVLISLLAGPGLVDLSGHFAQTIIMPPESGYFYVGGGPNSSMDETLLGKAVVLNRFGGMMKSMSLRSEELACQLRSRNLTAIIGCSGYSLDLPLASELAQKLGVAFIAYLFDDPVFQWTDERLERPFALLMESLWAPRAAKILAPNEELCSEVHARNQHLGIVPPIVIRNATEAGLDIPAEAGLARGPDEPWIIVYTGSVYHAQADAFRNLVEALDWIDDPWEIHVASHQNEEALARNGLVGPHVRMRGRLSHADTIALQQQADVLFLPLAFEVIPEVIRTSAPLKTGEYLASGRPILVHAPEHSWLSRFFRQRNCGIVVDRPDVAQLAAALLRLRKDESLRGRLAARQRNVAGEFTLEASYRAFWSVIDGVAGGAGQ
jgi:glycosyltransferase involved in cell wall biosynthesis